MDSILRLASKDRSSFLFKKSGQQHAEVQEAFGSGTDRHDSERLPNISHIDTASLVNLFDRFKSLEQSPEDDAKTLSQLMQDSTSSRDFAWPVSQGMKSTPSLKYQVSHTNMTTPAISSGPATATVGRNDSTGSSSLSRSSDSTPPITRHSSSSSVMPPISPLVPEKSTTRLEHLTALPQVSKSEAALVSILPLQRQARSRTWDSTKSPESRALDLDKPLPAGPPHGRPKNPNSSARRKQRRGDSLDSATVFRSADATLQTPTRFESLRRHARSTSVTFPVSDGWPVSGHQPRSPPTSRGARLGKAMANTGAHIRSKSENLLDGPKLENNKSHRSSAPVDPFTSSQKRKPLRSPPNPLTARTAEHVIYRIMTQLDDPQDLQSVALVSKGFLNTYQRNESKLVSHLIFKTSRSAWELRRSIVNLKGSKSFKLLDYQRDLRTIQALKRFILNKCRNSCRAKTVVGLLGEDKQCEREVESALWRIWTFCALFGDNASQNNIASAELDWLNGSNGNKSRALGAAFAVGNGEGLTVDELEDVSEMWCCLQALISHFHSRETEAKKAGVFDNWHLNDMQPAHHHLFEWTSYLLTLGPQVISSLSSGSFDRAKILGLTQWTLPPRGKSRSGFLMTAISHIYQERLLAEATVKAAQITLPSGPKHRPTKSLPNTQRSSSSPLIRQPPLRVDTQIQPLKKRRPVSTSTTPTTAPFEIRPDCDPANTQPQRRPTPQHTRSASTSAVSTLFPASPTSDPTIYHSLNLTAPANTASVKLGATLFPMEYTPTTPRVPFLSSPPPPTRAPPRIPGQAQGQGIIDPIDKAMHLLVQELGFKENNVKRALAMCDSGSGVDVQRAIELLMLESRREQRARAAPVELPTSSDMVSPMPVSVSVRNGRAGTGTVRRKGFCEGGCKTPIAVAGSAGGFASGRNSVARSATARQRRGSTDDDENQENEEVGNISPLTDIYGGVSDDDEHTLHSGHLSKVLDDDSSEMWRRREGNDTISPLMSAPAKFSALNTQSKKAWKVLGVQDRSLGLTMSVEEALRGAGGGGGGGSGGNRRSGLARMRSKSSGGGGVVGLEEYALRVERRRSMRLSQSQAVEKKGGTTMSVSAGLGEQLKGLGLMGQQQTPMSGGLGGFRVVQGVRERSGSGGFGGWGVQSEGEGEVVGRRESKWLGRAKTRNSYGNRKSLKEGCLPGSPCN